MHCFFLFFKEMLVIIVWRHLFLWYSIWQSVYLWSKVQFIMIIELSNSLFFKSSTYFSTHPYTAVVHNNTLQISYLWNPCNLTSATVCGDRTGSTPAAKRSASVGGGSRGTYITFASAMRIRQPTLALKPRGDVTRNPKQGYQWPQKWTCVCAKNFFKKKKKRSYLWYILCVGQMEISPVQ